MKELPIVEREFLNILECFMHEKEYHFPEGFSKTGNEINQLYELASVHKVTAVVYNQICREECVQQSATVMAFKRQTIQTVAFQAQREAGFLQVYQKLREQGLHPLVVKGAICRHLYAKPDYRLSGDEDMLLPKAEFEVCDRILLEAGFRREEVDLQNLPYEIPYVNSQNGVYIELHFSLFPEESGAYGHLNQEFRHVFDTCICEQIQQTEVWTLEPTMHLFYLICHSFKHFLHSGFGIRQVCDMMMMAEHYRERIEWNYIMERLHALRMDGFWNGLLEIGRTYLGFEPQQAGYPESLLVQETDCYNLLIDLLESGVFGDSTMERKHSSNVTLAAAESGKRNVTASLRASLFPNKSYMKHNYPWVDKYPFLLPVAWVLRICNYIKTSRKTAGEAGSMEIGMERVELLREYHIID